MCIRDSSQALFHGGIPSAHFVEDEKSLGAALATYMTPDMQLSPLAPEIGFIHRKLSAGDLYFIANTSNERKHVQAHFRAAARHAETWNAFSSEIVGLSNSENLELDLEPYESRLIFFSDAAMAAPPQPERHESVQVDVYKRQAALSAVMGL